MRPQALTLAGGLAAATLLATSCVAGPGPLTGDGGTGVQCSPSPQGRPVTQGFYELDNAGSTPVTVISVKLPPDAKGLAMTRTVWLVPIVITGNGKRTGTLIMGLGMPWPPTQGRLSLANSSRTWPTWRYRKPAIGGTIRPHQDLNLVFGLTRTTATPGTATGPVVTYTAGGSMYTLAENFGQELAANCS